CQPDRTVQPGVAWTFDQPIATDNCGTPTVQVLNTVTNVTGTNSLIATRTWQAQDGCGNTNTCKQTITALLGVAPTITAQPLGRSVGYGSNTILSVTATGTAPFSYQWRF